MADTVNSELARQLSRAGGMGIADSLVKALDRRAAAPAAATGTELGKLAPLAPVAPILAPDSSLHTHESTAPLNGKSVAMTSPYGWRADPFTGAHKYHAGIDLGAAYGTLVPAAGGGRVVAVGDQGAYGTQVVIEHATGLQTRYAHLSAVSVSVGDRVDQGQEVGRVGQSGRATGPHLHFEVIRDGQRVDPAGVMALGGSGFDGLKFLGSDADSPVGGRVVASSTTGADDENRGR
jgi:murein DD-endopeptidase MepM/ murein hydrolase activator NlpD